MAVTAFPNFDGAGRNAIAKEYRVNERIRVPQVRVVDERGEQFGV
ncbi:MAG: hypothetical protein F4Y96_02795, partial [Chloroflexi bacterium]|nr:hypothetical protein [Chloroflexota bacterium]